MFFYPAQIIALLLLTACSTSVPKVNAPEGETSSHVVSDTDDGTDANALGFPDPERNPSSPPPPWTLKGLGEESYTIRKPPKEACLQGYINKVAEERGVKPSSPLLARWILTASRLSKLDPIILTALIQQETGNFRSTDSDNGVGITQMTGNTITDTCFALEGTVCKKPMANPEYRDVWENHFVEAVPRLYSEKVISRIAGNNPDYRAFYPWRRAKGCGGYTFNVDSDCNRTCGITKKCMVGIRELIHADSRTAIMLGTFTLANKLADARRKNPRASLMTLYRQGLILYNGHARYKKNYAKKILQDHRLEILKACDSPILPEFASKI